MEENNIITIKELVKSYGDKTVLSIDNLTVEKGQSFGLVGNNGAGKTTLFSCLLDLIKPSTGGVTMFAEDVAHAEAWKLRVGAFVDDSFLISYLKPEEYFKLIAKLRNVSDNDLNALLETFSEIFNGEILGQKKYIRDLSKGNQKKVGIAATFIGFPELIILDEPFANLDPSTQIRLKRFLKQLHEEQKCTFLISSHDLNHVTEVCNRIVLLEKGKLVRDEIKSEQTLQSLMNYFEELV